MLPSVYRPVAMNCCVVPSGIAALLGVTSSEISSASVTCTDAPPDTLSWVADTVAVPTARPEARPVVVTPTSALLVEAHAAVAVTSLVVPSEYLAVAVSCRFMPFARLTVDGVTSMVTMTAGVTVSVVEPVIPDAVAAIIVVPVPTAVASPPVCGAMLMVATVASEDIQETLAVMS